MKRLPWIGIGLIAFLVIATQIPPDSEIVEQAKKYFSAEEIEQGQTFAFQRRWIFWANALAQLAMLAYLVFTPLGKRIYLATGMLVRNHWFAHLVVLAGAYYLASTAIGLPFNLARYSLNVSWGMTNQSLMSWLGDFALGVFVTGILEGAGVFGFYAIMRFFPKYWWMIAGIASVFVGFIVASLIPNFIAPLFNTFTPISQTEWKNFEPRIREMGKSIGAGAADIYVVDASRQSNASNAYFTGFGASQRIVLYDNLLKNHSPDEVETVIAHEMGHWWEQHILKGILLGGVAVTGGLFLLFRYLSRLVASDVLLSAADPAGLFRIILLAQLAFALTLPVQNGVSRWFERQADEMSLHLSKKPRAFIDAETNLAKLNKGNVTPSRINVTLFATHPPVVERIQRAEEWMKNATNKK